MREILSDRGIKEAIEKGHIQVYEPRSIISREVPLLQPASLDLVLAEDQTNREAYPLDYANEARGFPKVKDPLAPHPDLGRGFLTFWPGHTTTCRIKTLQGYDAERLNPIMELRSTMRRQGLDLDSQTPFEKGDFTKPRIINPLAYPISVELGSRISQVIWEVREEERTSNGHMGEHERRGYRVRTGKEFAALVDQGHIYMNGHPLHFEDSHLHFYASRTRKTNAQTPISITSQNRITGQQIAQVEEDKHILHPGQFNDVLTIGGIELSDKVAVRLLRPEKRGSARAGWVDNKYKGPLSAQVKAYEEDRTINAGEVVLFGEVMFFPAGVEQAYGAQAIGSQYQTNGTTARQLPLF